MKAALFDLDDTILDRSKSLRDFASWQASTMLRNYVDDPSEYTERFIALDNKGSVWKDVVYENLITEFSISNWTVDELLESYVLTFCAFCQPRLGAEQAIRSLKQNGYKVVLVTNGKSPFQERNFYSLGFAKYFDDIIVSDAVGLRKPDRAIFELACSRVNADIHTSVFIGDNPVADIEGAKTAGMKTIYTPTTPDVPKCEFADLTVGSLSEITKYV